MVLLYDLSYSKSSELFSPGSYFPLGKYGLAGNNWCFGRQSITKLN